VICGGVEAHTARECRPQTDHNPGMGEGVIGTELTGGMGYAMIEETWGCVPRCETPRIELASIVIPSTRLTKEVTARREHTTTV